MYNASYNPAPARNPNKPTFDSLRPIELVTDSSTGHRIRLTVEEAQTLANELRLAVSQANVENYVAEKH